MAKNFVSVATAAELGLQPVAEFDDGAIGFATDTGLHYTLYHGPSGGPVAGTIVPLAGNPVAGSPNALWQPSV